MLTMKCIHSDFLHVNLEYPVYVSTWICLSIEAAWDLHYAHENQSDKCVEYWHVVFFVSIVPIMCMIAFICQTIQKCKRRSTEEMEQPFVFR